MITRGIRYLRFDGRGLWSGIRRGLRFGPVGPYRGRVRCLCAGLAVGLLAAVPSVASAALPSGDYGSLTSPKAAGSGPGEYRSLFLPDVGFSEAERSWGDASVFVTGSSSANVGSMWGSLGEQVNGENLCTTLTASPPSGALIVETNRGLFWTSYADGLSAPSYWRSSNAYLYNVVGDGAYWTGTNSIETPPFNNHDGMTVLTNDGDWSPGSARGGAVHAATMFVILNDGDGTYTVHPWYVLRSFEGHDRAAYVRGATVSAGSWAVVLTSVLTQYSGPSFIDWNTVEEPDRPTAGWFVHAGGFAYDGALTCSRTQGLEVVDYLAGLDVSQWGYKAASFEDRQRDALDMGPGTEPDPLTPAAPSVGATSTAETDGSGGGWLTKYWTIARGWLEPLYGLFAPLNAIAGWD